MKQVIRTPCSLNPLSTSKLVPVTAEHLSAALRKVSEHPNNSAKLHVS